MSLNDITGDERKNRKNSRFSFRSDAYPEKTFIVVHLEGTESISNLFSYELILVSENNDINFELILQNKVHFEIYSIDGIDTALYHGKASAFDQLNYVNGYAFYRVKVVPAMWDLSQYSGSDVYLNEQIIPHIIESVLLKSRLTRDDYEFKISGDYRPRSFVCQYQESNFEFISRLMEREGIYYFFEHEGKKTENLVIIDDMKLQSGNVSELIYTSSEIYDDKIAKHAVRDLMCCQSVIPKSITLQDFNYRRAGTPLKVKYIISPSGIGEKTIFGENFRSNDEGLRYARIRAEEISSSSKVFHGQSTAIGIRAGSVVSVTGHYREDFNIRYLITEVRHTGMQAGALISSIHDVLPGDISGGETAYSCRFTAIPAVQQFRPPQVTRKPVIAGTMSAIIDGEGKGEYAELDEYGQYKVRLPYDSKDRPANQSSARIRLATPYAGSDNGLHFPLLKNSEVLLSFINGDPDQPVIISAVPNSENPNTVTDKNAYQNRIVSAGGNQISLDDRKGAEVMFIHSPFHNSTIGLGSIDPKGGGSIWNSTSGSFGSVTAGEKIILTGGTKVFVDLAIENSLAVGGVNNITVGPSTKFSLASDLQWSYGPKYMIDDGPTHEFKTEHQIQASKSVLISGGMRVSSDSKTKLAKKAMRANVITTLAAQAGMAAGACHEVAKNSDDTGPDVAKIHASHDINKKIAILHSMGSELFSIGSQFFNAGIVYGLLRNFDKVGYDSNMKLDNKGIKMDVSSTLNKKSSFILMDDTSINIRSCSNFILVKDDDDSVSVSADDDAVASTKLENMSVIPDPDPGKSSSELLLNSGHATLYTQDQQGKVSLWHSDGSVVVSQTGVLLKTAISTLSLDSVTGIAKLRSKIIQLG
ncbi:hypothetical protein A3780_20395 [Kosakonia radicincitans]|uniref:type VI secretion system Vgr family protein n=1 Tax=Kosakonia radicincitans TaxID=283686 RepID=UPI0009034896|nr:type VI secretion system tip protein TssI/VgrG [Kosakonia radicincitans]APG19806.1 hypothetical protein A3780_20395 [Kosakonia radicincitans]